MKVQLALVSHTNVGKTSLLRTLMRQDLGEVADRAHVTAESEAHTLVEGDHGAALVLWDTPGMGDSARLARRLEKSGQAFGWLLTEVWDRFADRPFYFSQKALQAVHEQADVVLYLANAAEDPAANAYVEHELRILRWFGKPVVLVLNQVGAAEASADERARWTARLADLLPAREALTLDAFARCWVQEDRLFAAVAAALPPAKQQAFAELRRAWRRRNLAVLGQSMKTLAAALAATARDREVLPADQGAGAIAGTLKRWIAHAKGRPASDAAAEAAMQRMASRALARESEALDVLISLHGLAGRARERVLAQVSTDFTVKRPADVAASGVLGGLVSGAAGGLAADVATGGLSLGLGALVGGILGALGAGGGAYAFNAVQGTHEGAVSWQPPFLRKHAEGLLLLYLAVAHFGRARGPWTEGTVPDAWRAAVTAALEAETPAIDAAAADTTDAGELAAAFDRAVRRALATLYPESSTVLQPEA